jgi:hypothetical protein
MLNGRTMSCRLLATVLAIATVSACSYPRTGIVAGAATMIAGGVILAKAQPDPDENNPFAIWGTLIGDTVGVSVMAAGLGVIVGGLVGLALEKPESSPVPSAPEPALQPTLQPAASDDGPPTVRPAAELAVQLRIAARAGHCETATHIAHELVRIDSAMAVALVKSDHDVARCLAARM